MGIRPFINGTSLLTVSNTCYTVVSPFALNHCDIAYTLTIQNPNDQTPLCSGNPIFKTAQCLGAQCSEKPTFRHLYVPTPLCLPMVDTHVLSTCSDIPICVLTPDFRHLCALTLLRSDPVCSSTYILSIPNIIVF